MKQILGGILFALGFLDLLNHLQTHDEVSNIAFWFIFLTVAIGLELVINGLIDDMKKELDERIDELENK